MSLRYEHTVSDISIVATLSLTGEFRTIQDILNALQINDEDITTVRVDTDGSSLILTPDEYRLAYPLTSTEIVCIDTSNLELTSITLDMTTGMSPTLTIVDGDPQILLHQVSETEPTPRGSGDSWYNPITKTLSIFTEDS